MNKTIDYPRRFMTITELVNLGFSRESLKRWVHMKGFPCLRNSPRGAYKIDVIKLDPWLVKNGLKKRDAL